VGKQSGDCKGQAIAGSYNDYGILAITRSNSSSLKLSSTDKRKGRRCSGHSNGGQICTLLFFFLFRASPAAYGGSQARGPIRATAASLHHSHGNARSEPCLRPTPQLTATADPELTERGQGSNPQPHGS